MNTLIEHIYRHRKRHEYHTERIVSQCGSTDSNDFWCLLEDHYDVICDELWYIHTDENVRAMRLKESRGYDDEKIASICANQKSPEEFRSACQVTIDNSGDLADTYRQIDEQLGR